jgi:hypothetical protein
MFAFLLFPRIKHVDEFCKPLSDKHDADQSSCNSVQLNFLFPLAKGLKMTILSTADALLFKEQSV